MSHKFVAFDFETANQYHDSPCAIGLVRVENSQIIAKEMRLINPNTFFAWFCVNVHGLTEEDVIDAPLFDEVWQEITPILEDVNFLAAHNAPFDKSVLYKTCNKYNLAPPPHKITCSIKAAKSFLKLPSYSLDNVCDHLGIELNHHEALSDAEACAEIMIRAFEQGYKV